MRWPITSNGLHVSPPSCASVQPRGSPRSSASSVAGVRVRIGTASSRRNARRVRSSAAVGEVVDEDIEFPSFSIQGFDPLYQPMDISRRALLVGIGAAPFAPLVLRAQRRTARPKLAAICTTYFKYSHAQHIVDRFLEGYGWNGTHHRSEERV